MSAANLCRADAGAARSFNRLDHDLECAVLHEVIEVGYDKHLAELLVKLSQRVHQGRTPVAILAAQDLVEDDEAFPWGLRPRSLSNAPDSSCCPLAGGVVISEQ